MKDYTAKQLKELYKSPKYFLECLQAELSTLTDEQVKEILTKYVSDDNAKRKA